MVIVKCNGDKRQTCLIPVEELKYPSISPLRITKKWMLEIQPESHFIKRSRKPLMIILWSKEALLL